MDETVDEKYQKVLECIESLNFNDGTYLKLCNALKTIKNTTVEQQPRLPSPQTLPTPPPRSPTPPPQDPPLYVQKVQEYETKAMLAIGPYPYVEVERLYAERYHHNSREFCDYMLSYYDKQRELCKIDMLVYQNNIKNKVKGHIRSSQKILKDVYNPILDDIRCSKTRWYNGGVW
jgi:hypothetical protein